MTASFTAPFTITSASSPIVGGTPGSQQIGVQTTTLGRLSPYLFGIATEGMNAPGVNNYAPALNAGFQAAWRGQNIRHFRHNAAGTLADWINNTSAPQNWFSGAPSFFGTNTSGPNDYSHNLQTFTLGGSEGGEQATPAQCVTIANRFRNAGLECFWWEVYNEPDISSGSYVTLFNSCKNALKGVNPNYMVGGPVVNFATNDSYMSALVSANPDFVSWHKYWNGNSGASGYFNAATSGSEALGSGSNQYQFIKQFFPNALIYVSEWNMVDNATETLMTTSDGGVWVSLALGNLLAAAGPLAWGAAIWEQCANGDYHMIDNDGARVWPQALVLGKLGRAMGGTQNQVTSNNIPSTLKCFASNDGTNWAVWITNMATSGSPQPLGVVGLTGSSYQYWELSPANFNPPLVLSNQPIGNLLSLSIPNRSVVVLTSANTQ